MADSFIVHREARKLIGVNFEDELEPGTVITGMDWLVILDAAGVDVTEEFRGEAPVADPVIDNDELLVSFWKEPAADAAAQAAGTYKVKMRVMADNAEKPVPLGTGYRLIRLEIVGD